MLAEALRLGKRCGEARKEYEAYLQMSDFDSKLAGKLNYYVLGYVVGMGECGARRRRTSGGNCSLWRTTG